MKRLVLLSVCLTGLMYAPSAQAQLEPSGIDERSRGEFIHRESGTVFRTPIGWQVITPQRLRKESASTVMGIERQGDTRAIVNVTYSPLEGKKLTDFISLTADKTGEFGEEHALLTTIYGKTRVGAPTKKQVGPFTVYQIKVEPGVFPEDQTVGTVYMFETGTAEKNWKVKIRTNVPKISETSYMDLMDGLLNGFTTDGR